MYKKNLESAEKIVFDALNQNKEALILAKYDDVTLYPIKEHISIVNHIERNYTPNGMAKLRLQFKNKLVDTIAYIDDFIQVGIVVSTIGFLYESGDISSYYCKGGINPVLTNLMDIDKFYPNKVYRMGMVLELSEVNTSQKYYTYDKDVKKLEDVNGFYYIIQEKDNPKTNEALTDTSIKNIVDRVGKSNTTIDTSIFSNIEEEEEDYPDDPGVSIKKDLPMI